MEVIPETRHARMASFFRTRQLLESPMSIRLLEEIVDAMFQLFPSSIPHILIICNIITIAFIITSN
jgi:hypothetical protein